MVLLLLTSFMLRSKVYGVTSKLGATSVVPVTAVIPALEPVLSYKGSGISHVAIVKQNLNIKGIVTMGITSYKEAANGFDGVVTIKYPKSIQLLAPEAAGYTYNLGLSFEVISGEIDKGIGKEIEIELLVPLGMEVLKNIGYTITGIAPVAGKYEGVASFTLEYN